MVKPLIDKEKAKAAEVCLEKGIPFCLFAFPHSESHFFSNPSGASFGLSDKRKKFIIGRWNTKIKDSIVIYNELDAENTVSFAKSIKSETIGETPWKESTLKENYLEGVTKVIGLMKEKRLEKVVISRVEFQEENISYSKWINTAEKVFSAYPETFRFLYWTRSTGGWMGASPELLLDYECSKKTVSTVALAGTRRMESSTVNDDWSGKDSEEQRIVAGYLENALGNLNMDVRCLPTETINAGPLQHISTMMIGVARYDDLPPYEMVLDNIQPTPALSGYPKEKAISLIESVERHPRRCYGGCVGVEDQGDLKAYVNIRCLNFDENGYCMYAGGGILPQSDPDVEWIETEGKLKVLSNFIC